MLGWLSKLFSARKTELEDPDVLVLKQLRGDLDKDSSEFPLADLRPILIPSPILAMDRWVGPCHYFDNLPVSLTWAFLRPHQTMMYLSHSAAESFAARGIDWRAAARAARREDFESQAWTHEFPNESGEIAAVALFHDDGLGPSRLLCLPRLLERFPGGLSFFVPERSAALVLFDSAGAKVRESVQRVVQSCFEAADVPMSAEPFRYETLKAALERVGEL